MSDYHTDVPVRHYRHFLCTWKIRHIHGGLVLFRNGLYSKEFKLQELSKTIWKLGLKETANGEAFKFFILRNQTDNPGGRVFVKLRAEVKTDFFNGQYKTNHSGWSVNNEPFTIPIAISKKDYVRHIETSYKWYMASPAWIISVEISCNEEEYETYGRENTLISKIDRSIVQLGVDLYQFVMNPKFADLTVRYKSLESPVHRAIIDTRCPTFFRKHCNMFGEVIFSRKYSRQLFFFFLLFVYSGNFDILIDVGTLPVGIHKFAKRLEAGDLASLAQPIDIHTRTDIVNGVFQFPVSLRTEALIGSDQLRCTSPPVNVVSDINLVCILSKTTDPDDDDQYIGIEIKMVEGSDSLSIVVQCCLRAVNGDKVEKVRSLFYLEPNARVGFPHFMKVSFLKENRARYDRNGFTCFVTSIYVGKNCCDRRKTRIKDRNTFKMPKEVDLYYDIRNSFSSYFTFWEMAKDIKRLLTDPRFSDLEVQCGEHKRAVHKILLAARSSWFSKRIDQLEDSTLVVTDISEEDLDNVLYEIYTGKLEITETNVFHLYEISCKFDLLTLRERCRIDIKDTLTVENCLLPLELAISYKDDILKNIIVDNHALELHEISDLPWFKKLIDEESSAATMLVEKWKFLSTIIEDP